MALRELAFDIAFNGDARAVQQMDSAVDGVRDSAVNMGDTIDRQGKRSTNAFKTMAKYAAGALSVAAVVKFGKALINTASEIEEMQGKFNVVFDGMSEDVANWANEQANAMGRSKYEIQGYLAESQNMFVGMGMTREAGAELSKQIATLGIDLASFNNLQDADAVNKLNKAIMGETESAKSLGAVLNENTLALAQEELGIKGKFQALSEAEKMQVRYQAIVMQSADAIGDAERTSDSYANQMRRLKANISDTVGEMGQALLPIASKVLQLFNSAIPIIRSVAEKAFDYVGNAIRNVAERGSVIMPFVIAIKDSFLTAMASVVPSVLSLWDVIKTNLIPVVFDLLARVQEQMPTIQKVMGTVFDVVATTITVATKAIELFIKVASSIYEKLKPVLDMLGTAFEKTFGVISNVVGGVSNVIGRVTGRGTATQQVGRNARGTSYWGGGLTMVGEEGPELVNLNKGAKVYSNEKTGRMMAGGGSSVNNNISININGAGGNAREIANTVRKEVEKALDAQNKKMMLRWGVV